MRALDYLDALPVREPSAALHTVLDALRDGTPIAFAEGTGWRVIRPIDALSLPPSRQLCDVPSVRLPTLRVVEPLDLATLSAHDVWGATKNAQLVGRVDRARVLNALADAQREDATELLSIAARDRLMPKLLHDLSNALTIATYGNQGPADGSLAHAADEAVRHASALVMQMRSLYGAGTAELERVFDLRELVASMEPMLRLAARPAHLESICASPAAARVARWRLESALLNLVLNASERAEEIRVTVRGARHGGTRIDVEDDGPGFKSLDPEAYESRQASLRGHGLASIRRQVTAMGGQLRLGRAALGGALVSIRLPPA